MQRLAPVVIALALVFGLNPSAGAADRAPVTYSLGDGELVRDPAPSSPVSVVEELRAVEGDHEAKKRVLAESLARLSSSSSTPLYSGDELWIPTGDLDGDGGDDLVRMEQTSEYLLVHAVRGIDGSDLWSYAQQGSVGRAFPALVGPDATVGLLVVTHGYESAGVTLTGLRVAALDAQGIYVWAAHYDGVRGPYVGSEQPFVSAIADAAPGAATDILVSRETYAVTVWRIDTDVLNGADGSVVSASQYTPSRYPHLMTVTDLSGDGYDDYVWMEDGGFPPRGMPITAFASDDGRELWSSSGPATYPYYFYERLPLTDVGDVTGDGASDLVFWAGDYAYHYWTPFDDSTMWLYDGATGQLLWGARASNPRPIGDVDGDGLPDIGTVTPDSQYWNDEIRVRHAVYTGDGDTIYDVAYVLPVDSDHENTTRVTVTPDAGDVDADGLSDAGHDIRVVDWDEDTFAADRGVVSGQDAALVWSGSVQTPLFASVDGQGDDLYRSRWSEHAISFETFDGATGEPLWGTDIAGSDIWWSNLDPLDVDGDARSELLLQLETYDYETYRYRKSVHVLSAVDGSTLWMRE